MLKQNIILQGYFLVGFKTFVRASLTNDRACKPAGDRKNKDVSSVAEVCGGTHNMEGERHGLAQEKYQDLGEASNNRLK